MQQYTSLSHDKLCHFEQKIILFKKKFEPLITPEQKYRQIIAFGENLPSIDPKNISSETRVRGCQSELHIHAEQKQGKIFFTAQTDALISRGLAALLIEIYNGEDAETILSSPPHFLETLGIHASLSPNRSQGVSHIYLKMKLQSILLAKDKLLGNS